MGFEQKHLTLYAVTDRSWLQSASFHQQIEKIAQAGVTMIQLREKDLPFDEFVAETQKIKKITQAYGIPLIINDRVDVALAGGADGVHLGQGDMDASQARELLGTHKILGVTAKTVEQAKAAEQAGADYLGTGAIFGTSTKKDALPITMEQLKEVCSAVSIPVVGIGGIDHSNILQMKGSGVAGVAVVSAIFAKKDIGQATKELRALADELVMG